MSAWHGGLCREREEGEGGGGNQGGLITRNMSHGMMDCVGRERRGGTKGVLLHEI